MDDVQLFFVFGCWMLMIDCIIAYVFYRFPWLKALIFPHGHGRSRRIGLLDWIGVLFYAVYGAAVTVGIAGRLVIWLFADGAIFRLYAFVDSTVYRLLWPYGAGMAFLAGCVLAIPAHFQRERLVDEITAGCERLERAIYNRVIGAHTYRIPTPQPRSPRSIRAAGDLLPEPKVIQP